MQRLSFLLPLFLLFPLQNHEWELVKSHSGIKVWLAEEGGFYRVKVQMMAQAKMDDFQRVFENFSGHVQWSNRLKKSQVLQNSHNKWVLKMVLESPWPLRDRYQIVNCTKNKQSKLLNYTITPVERGYAIDNAVRISNPNGYWHVEDLGNGYIKITHEFYGNPKINFPKSWSKGVLANEMFNTFKNIGKLL